MFGLGKPQKGEKRKPKPKEPEHPWPVGSLCTNVVSFQKRMIEDLEKSILVRRDPEGFIPDMELRAHSEERLHESAFLYLGMLPADASWKLRLVFMCHWGLATWEVPFTWDGRSSSRDAFQKTVSDAWRCVCRTDKALG